MKEWANYLTLPSPDCPDDTLAKQQSENDSKYMLIALIHTQAEHYHREAQTAQYGGDHSKASYYTGRRLGLMDAARYFEELYDCKKN